jgi:hypothetical protein
VVDATGGSGDDAIGENTDKTGGDQGDGMDAPLIPVDACKEFLLEPVSRPTVYIGTIMLSRLKDAMAKAGIRAELAGGILCVENHDTGAVVLVKKTASQSVVLEGALCEEYYAVRDVLVSQLVSIPDM